MDDIFDETGIHAGGHRKTEELREKLNAVPKRDIRLEIISSNAPRDSVVAGLPSPVLPYRDVPPHMWAFDVYQETEAKALQIVEVSTGRIARIVF